MIRGVQNEGRKKVGGCWWKASAKDRVALGLLWGATWVPLIRLDRSSLTVFVNIASNARHTRSISVSSSVYDLALMKCDVPSSNQGLILHSHHLGERPNHHTLRFSLENTVSALFFATVFVNVLHTCDTSLVLSPADE